MLGGFFFSGKGIESALNLLRYIVLVGREVCLPMEADSLRL
jgi:hypothetical protein